MARESKAKDFGEHPEDFARIGLLPSQALEVATSMFEGGSLPDAGMTGLTTGLMALWLDDLSYDYYDRFADYDQADAEHGKAVGGIRYDEAARRAGHRVLHHYQAHPGDYFVSEHWLWRLLREDLEALLPLSDLTCFQWGWAINAARYALSWEPMPNPAFTRVGGIPALIVMTRDEMDSYLEPFQS